MDRVRPGRHSGRRYPDPGQLTSTSPGASAWSAAARIRPWYAFQFRPDRADQAVHCSVLLFHGRRQLFRGRFFRDQIEASEVIQRELHHPWRRHPGEVPAAKADLAAEARPKLDQVTTQIIQRFERMNEMPRFAHRDITDLIDKRLNAAVPGRQLPTVQRYAAIFAMRSFSGKPGKTSPQPL